MAARQLNRLSARAVATIKAPGRHSDGGGLYLSVSQGGARSWVFMYTLKGKQREMGLGSASPASLKPVSLARARELAADARANLGSGVDPLAARVALAVAEAGKVTFGACADAMLDSMESSWRNEKHKAQWRMTLLEYANGIRALPVADIGTSEVLSVLTPIWGSKPETASRLRGRIERVLDSAKAKGLRSGENPARWRGHLDQLLPKRQKLSRGHHAAMPFRDLPAFMASLGSRDAAAARALEFTILTAARTGEMLGANPGEFDLDAGIWAVPAERMKIAKVHRVPLSARAVDIVTTAIGANGKFAFDGSNGKPLSSMAMAMLLRRMKVDYTVHGFRSAFSDWVAETTDYSSEVREASLSHTIENKAEAAYRRGDLFDKRRALMNDWAAFCAGASRGE